MAGLPDPSLLKEIEYRAVEMARETGLFLTESQMTPGTVEYKGRGRSSPVTPADREAEERLRRSIQQRFPGHSILGEEGEVVGSDGAPFLWVLDPLDGTSNFIGRLAVFAVSVGVLYEGVPVAAALFLPASSGNGGRVYHARRDGGAFAEEQPIAVASLATPEDGRLVAFPAHYGRRFRLSTEVRRRRGEVRHLGSIAYEMALTAEGVFQYALFSAPRLWDIAAGALLVREAGGEVLQWRKGRWTPFGPVAAGTAKEIERLKEWRAPVLAGPSSVVQWVAGGLKVRRLLLWRLWWRLRARG